MSVPPRSTAGPSWAEDLSSLLAAMRDTHGAMLELEAREARLFELVERVTRRLLDEHARALVPSTTAQLQAERDPALVTESELRLMDGNR